MLKKGDVAILICSKVFLPLHLARGDEPGRLAGRLSYPWIPMRSLSRQGRGASQFASRYWKEPIRGRGADLSLRAPIALKQANSQISKSHQILNLDCKSSLLSHRSPVAHGCSNSTTVKPKGFRTPLQPRFTLQRVVARPTRRVTKPESNIQSHNALTAPRTLSRIVG
jgi:hypothetical protein